MTELDDPILVRRCLEGDRESYGTLVARHQRAVFNVALRMLKDFQDAQDLTQTVFIKAYEKLDTYKAEHKFFSWIYRMTVNEALNNLKRSRRFEGLGESTEHLLAEQRPEQDYEESETSRNLQRALMLLQNEHRAVIVLKHLEELSYEEIGYILGLPVKTVKSRLFTARQVLKTILIKQGYLEHDRQPIH